MNSLKLLSLLFLTFISLQAHSQEICIKLESINIGCVPSQSHVCYLNKNIELDGGNGNCKYTKLEMTGQQYEAPTGAIAFYCASEVSETKCEKQPGSDNTICTTTTTCKEYSKPVCQEVCILCHKKEKQEPKTAVGCIVCTRPECQEEKEARPSSYCPAVSSTDPEYVIPKFSRPLCGGRRCNPNATDPTKPSEPFPYTLPDGSVQEVTINASGCPAPAMVEKGEGGTMQKRCPWIRDPRPYYVKDGENVEIDNNSTSAQIAEACGNVFPIKSPNRFPEDWTPPQ